MQRLFRYLRLGLRRLLGWVEHMDDVQNKSQPMAWRVREALVSRSAQRLLGLVLLAVFLVLVLTHPHQHGAWRAMVDQADRAMADYRMQSLPRDYDHRIAIVDIDENALKNTSHWPLSTTYLADLANTLFEHYNINTLGLDVDLGYGSPFTTEKGAAVLHVATDSREAYQSHHGQSDQILADAIKRHKIVLGYRFSNYENDRYKVVTSLPPAIAKRPDLAQHRIPLHEWRGAYGNMSIFNSPQGYAGYTNMLLDKQGLFRSLPLLSVYQDHYYDSFALAVLQAYIGKELELVFHEGANWRIPNSAHSHHQDEDQSKQAVSKLKGIAIGDIYLATTNKSEILIPFLSDAKAISHYRAEDILNRKIDPKKLRDAVVVAGVMDSERKSFAQATLWRVSGYFPNHEMQANVIHGLLHKKIAPQWPYIHYFLAVVIAIYGLIYLATSHYIKPWGLTLMYALGVAVSMVISYALLQYAGQHVPMFYWLLFQTVFFVLFLALSSLRLHYGRMKTAMRVAEYIPRQIANRITADRYDDKKDNIEAAETREITTMFVDIVNFSGMAEKMPAQQVSAMLNELFSMYARVIDDNNGITDKYIGDAIMALWNAPNRDPKHASHAVATALLIMQRLELLSTEFNDRGWPPVKAVIGIHTGMAHIGNMGSSLRRSYTAIGDSVNLASRLEVLTREYAINIAVSEQVTQKAPEFLYRYIDSVVVRGRSQQVVVYEPIALKSQATQHQFELARGMDQVYEAMQHHNYHQAREFLLHMNQQAPCALYRHHLNRLDDIASYL